MQVKTGHKIKGFFSGNVGMLNRSRAGNVVMFLFLLIFAIYSALPVSYTHLTLPTTSRV